MSDPSQILYACPSDDVIVFRIQGRGTFLNSAPFKSIIQTMQARNPQTTFILDMRECESMDSTFMGVLAGVGLAQRREKRPNLTLVNVSDRVRKLLTTLGLAHFLDIRSSIPEKTPLPEIDAFQQTDPVQANREDQILHMIQAHQDLVHLDSSNKIRFENVLKYLSDSLEKSRE